MFRNRRNLFEVLLLKNNERGAASLYSRYSFVQGWANYFFLCVKKCGSLVYWESMEINFILKIDVIWYICYTLFKFQCFILPLRLFDYSCTLTVIKISRKNARLGTWNQSTYHHTQSAFHVRKFPWRPSSVYKYVEKKPWRVSIPAVSVYIVQNIRFKYRLEDV